MESMLTSRLFDPCLTSDVCCDYTSLEIETSRESMQSAHIQPCGHAILHHGTSEHDTLARESNDANKGVYCLFKWTLK